MDALTSSFPPYKIVLILQNCWLVYIDQFTLIVLVSLLDMLLTVLLTGGVAVRCRVWKIIVIN